MKISIIDIQNDIIVHFDNRKEFSNRNYPIVETFRFDSPANFVDFLSAFSDKNTQIELFNESGAIDFGLDTSEFIILNENQYDEDHIKNQLFGEFHFSSKKDKDLLFKYCADFKQVNQLYRYYDILENLEAIELSVGDKVVKIEDVDIKTLSLDQIEIDLEIANNKLAKSKNAISSIKSIRVELYNEYDFVSDSFAKKLQDLSEDDMESGDYDEESCEDDDLNEEEVDELLKRDWFSKPSNDLPN
jgi:hypothetical protein